MQRKVAEALRKRLANETEPRRLRGYETLWGLEFRTRPPQEHDAIRQRVAEDLKRIESTAGKPEADFLVFLRDGQRQSGASKERINAIEDRVLREYPRSSEAYRITYERWRTGHKEPEDHKDRAAWAKYDLEYRRTLKQWIEQFTEDRSFGARYWYYAISRDPDIPEKDGIEATPPSS